MSLAHIAAIENKRLQPDEIRHAMQIILKMSTNCPCEACTVSRAFASNILRDIDAHIAKQKKSSHQVAHDGAAALAELMLRVAEDILIRQDDARPRQITISYFYEPTKSSGFDQYLTGFEITTNLADLQGQS